MPERLRRLNFCWSCLLSFLSSPAFLHEYASIRPFRVWSPSTQSVSMEDRRPSSCISKNFILSLTFEILERIFVEECFKDTGTVVIF